MQSRREQEAVLFSTGRNLPCTSGHPVLLCSEWNENKVQSRKTRGLRSASTGHGDVQQSCLSIHAAQVLGDDGVGRREAEGVCVHLTE